MIRALLLVPLIACFPPRSADCQTPGGLYVQGGDCSSIYPVQQEIEREAEVMGLGSHVLYGQLIWVRREPSGGFDGPSGPSGKVAGLTYCESGMSIVVLDGDDWRHSAFVHEAFHLAQHCVYDDALFTECVKTGGEGCDFKAAHPHWDKDVYPAIVKISNR